MSERNRVRVSFLLSLRYILLISFFLFLSFHVLFADTNPGKPRGISCEVDSAKIYVGDAYSIFVKAEWDGSGSSEKSLFGVDYKSGSGRQLLRISRKDNSIYNQNGNVIGGKTEFVIHVRGAKDSPAQGGEVSLLYRVGQDGKILKKTFEIQEPAIHSKILGVFRLGEFLLLIVGLLALISLSVVLFFVLKRRRSKRTAEENMTDEGRLEINALGRLLDFGNENAFINAANAFIARFKKLLFSVGETGDAGIKLDPELKRENDKIEKILADARFSGYKPKGEEMEFIYKFCKRLYEIKTGI